MLELRPNCECCDRDLPNGSPDARICTYECAEARFAGRCPNCGGDLVPRPARAAAALARDPASTVRVRKAHPQCAAVGSAAVRA